MTSLIYIFLGGGVGSIVRFGLSLATSSSPEGFPWATFAANLIASLLLGIFIAARVKYQWSDHALLLLGTGFCGGFSTFSTFSYESFYLLQVGQEFLAFLYILISVTTCIGAIFIGWWIVQLIP